MNSLHRPGLWLFIAVLLALAFFACSIWTLPLLSRYRGDERFYTTAAIHMINTGDYLTPVTAQGTHRFNKPVLNYWLIAACYQLLGVNVLSGRLAQLIAGTLALLAAYRLARVLYEDHRVALACVAILLVNEEVLNTSVRSTTDIVQFLCITVALAGLAAIILRNSRSRLDYLLTFGGLGMAIFTKGGMSLVVLGFAAVFAALLARRLGQRVWPAIRSTLPLAGLLLMFLPIGLWLAVVTLQHGSTAIGGLVYDQVGVRLDSEEGSARPLHNLFFYTTSPLTDFLPWTIALSLVALIAKSQVRAVVRERKAELTFALGLFTAIIVAVFIGNITRTRYMLPSYGPLAAGVAYLLLALTDRSIQAAGAFRIFSFIAALVLLAFAIVLGVLALRLPGFIPGYAKVPPWTLPAALAAASVACSMWLRSRHVGACARVVAVALLGLAAYRMADLVVRGHLFTDSTREIIAAVQQPGALAVVGLHTEAGQIRILTEGRLEIAEYVEQPELTELQRYPAVLVPGHVGLDLGVEYQEVLVPPRTAIWKPADLVRLALGRTTLEQLRARRGMPVRLLIRNDE